MMMYFYDNIAFAYKSKNLCVRIFEKRTANRESKLLGDEKKTYLHECLSAYTKNVKNYFKSFQ